ncbi:hypothetical protein [Nonomuraea rubra]|uniref:hypothetical protein n=1 Tax=Nonomuraea rubra TaxID=46180 RepID=UPI0033EE8AA9
MNRPAADPLTAEQQQIARGVIAEWFDAAVSKAEAELAAAEARVAKAHKRRAEWVAGEPLTESQATLIAADNSLAFIDEAQRLINGEGGDREKAEGLRAAHKIVARYLRDTYGHDTGGID